MTATAAPIAVGAAMADMEPVTCRPRPPGFELPDGLVGDLGVDEDVVAGWLHGGDRREVTAPALHRELHCAEHPSDDRTKDEAVEREKKTRGERIYPVEKPDYPNDQRARRAPAAAP